MTEHPDLTRLREREARAVARGYTRGDVNHHVQHVIGHLRMYREMGYPLTDDYIDYAIKELGLACDAETAWLAAAPVDGSPDQPTDGGASA